MLKAFEKKCLPKKNKNTHQHKVSIMFNLDKHSWRQARELTDNDIMFHQFDQLHQRRTPD